MSLEFNAETGEIIHNGLARYLSPKKDYPVEVFVWLKDSSYSFFEKLNITDVVPLYDETWEFLGSVTIPANPELLLEKRKKELLAHLYSKVNQIYSQLLSNYSVLEKESWTQQEYEARALLAVQTPTIDALCAVRGCSRDELAKKIVANADSAKFIGVSILSWQQGIEANIKNMDLNDFASLWDSISEKELQ